MEYGPTRPIVKELAEYRLSYSVVHLKQGTALLV